MDIKRIKKYFEQLYAQSFDSLGKLNKFLKKLDLPKFLQEEKNSLNNPVSIK